ncbi:MAG TPA: NifU family protein [Gemmatimonadaceae bacterium]|nr:NifU family protein [Gemmatimonadaceae bacterium]
MSLFKQHTSHDVDDRIRTAIDGVRALLRIETMDIELVEFDSESGVAVIRCAGDCPGCDLSAENLTVGIEAHLRLQVPEIRSIRFVAR